jgi:hypothetical protein
VIEINDECMSLTLSGETLATARFSQHTAAHGNAHGSSQYTLPGCSAATRRSRL